MHSRTALHSLLTASFVALALACSSESATNENAAGSGGVSAGGSSSNASAGSGGTAQGTGGADTIAEAGASQSGAGGNTGGASSAGSAGEESNAGSAGVAGAGGMVSTGPVMSPGCGSANPSTGDLQIEIQQNEAHFIVSIPADYDENHPYPLGFGFHGRDRTGPNCQQGDCAGFQAAFEDDTVLVYMTSLGGTGWEGQDERELNVTFFRTVLTRMKDEYCIDESRVFVAGTSSGANFTNVLACRFADQLLAVSPVAGGPVETDDCQGPVAALVIHGVDDYHVPFASGIEMRDLYVERNGCTDSTDVPISELHDSVVANLESHQCANYQGCPTASPVTWCEHSEGGYDGSTHGWPLFGGEAIRDFVTALP